MKKALTLCLALVVVFACGEAREKELHVLNWSDYFAPDTITNFEKEFDCRVTIDYIESTETLRLKLAKPPSGYDVVFPSDEVVQVLISGGQLDPLDRTKIANFGNLDPRFRGLPFDPENRYTVPYMWGTTGLAMNVSKVDPVPDSWAVLWDPKYEGRVTLLDDSRDAMAAAMFVNGDDPHAPTAESIARARDKLATCRPRAWISSVKDMLVSGDAWICQAFNGDAMQAGEAEERAGDIAFVIPKEGGFTWFDNMAIAKGAPHPDLAHAFIDYLLRPEVSAAISNEVCYANPNLAARPLIDKAQIEDPTIYPDEETMGRCRVLVEPPEALKPLLIKAWAEVKAR
ncbi:MAG: spermidine/putrescine ABC transporter substrate-binding protein [Planctomycetes bacterium]|jgi:spermidine/putrescine-binding protein|nr:spermidine/putrescine ABC transporter substrate-binding protein [Planctomycetota bacterium]